MPKKIFNKVSMGTRVSSKYTDKAGNDHYSNGAIYDRDYNRKMYQKIQVSADHKEVIITRVTQIGPNRKRVEKWKREVAEVWEEYDEKEGRWDTFVRAKGRAYNYHKDTVAYEWTASTRVDNGAKSLANQFRAEGLNGDEIDDVMNMFDSLSNKDKGEVWNEYRKSSTVGTYGSGSFDETVSIHTDAKAYFQAFKSAVEKVKGI